MGGLATADVTVMGAGIFGLSVAWQCQKRGAAVQVIDPNGVAAGASGGVVGALAPHTPENWNAKKAFQLDSLLMAEGFWRAVDQVSGLSSGYGRTGRLQSVASQRALDLGEERANGAHVLWQDRATWALVPVREAGEWAPRSEMGFLIHDTLSARVHPRKACESLAAAISAKGGHVLRQGNQEGKVVWATGWAGLRALSERAGKQVGTGIKGQAALLRHAAPIDSPQLFVDGLHVVPHSDGTVAIGSTSERDFDAPQTTDAQLAELIERAMAAVPVLRGAQIAARWAGVRPRAKSRAPMIGPLPYQDGHFVANGGFKIGFGMAPKLASVLAALILDDVDEIPSGFRLEDNL